MQQAGVAYQSGDWAKAEHLCRLVLNAHSGYLDALYLLGIITAQTRRLPEAAELFGRAVDINPGNATAHNNLGLALQDLGRLDDALTSFERALELAPSAAEAHLNRGNVLKDLKRLDEALESYNRALAINPDYAAAHNNRGLALQALQRLDEAVASYDQAIRLKPDLAEAHINRGNALKDLKRQEEALTSYNEAIRLVPGYAEAYYNRGVALQDLQRLDEALTSYDQAIALKPDYVEACNNRGNVLKNLQRPNEALASYDRALALDPRYAEAHNNRGNALKDLKRLDAALASYDEAIRLKPDYADAYNNRGLALQELKRIAEALASYDRAITLKPDYEFLSGRLLHAKMLLCDWAGVTSLIAELADKVLADRRVTPPFPVLAVADSPILHRKAAEIWVEARHPASRALPPIAKRARRGKIRIGYYSADFYAHATAHLMAGLFERHDRDRFALVALSFGPDSDDDMRKRVSAAFERFIDVRDQSDREVALLSRSLEIDIAVDLKGFTNDARVDILAHRAAPIQVNFLGYPGTMGASYIDYIIADGTLIPVGSEQHYSEKVVRLPHSYQANDRTRKIADSQFSRDELGLPPTGFVFCCFNNNYKITPTTFQGWMRILTQVEGSVLWLFEDNPTASANLRREAEARGISGARLVFAQRIPLPEHLARHRAADLFLDTLPCNAHTTASDALWAGLPVLTCAGNSFASRVAASLLNAIGLPELVTTTEPQYEALAIELATDPRRLAGIRQKLARNRLTKPLFDTELFTGHIEAAYTQMYERYQADLPPDHIHVTQ